MPLFKNIDTVKKYYPLTTSSTAIPHMQEVAEEEYLLPVLGATLLGTVQTEADTNPVTPSPLLKKCYQALAFLMYYKQLPFLYTQTTDAGLRNVTTNQMQGAYPHQYYDIKRTCENEGLAALNRLFTYLYDNRATYTTWYSSAAYQRLNRNILRTGLDFADYFTLPQPHRTFYALQPIVQEVEDFYVNAAIGETFFTSLKAITSPTTHEAEVIKLLKKAVAQLTIFKSFTKLSVKISPEGFNVMLGNNDAKATTEAQATDGQVYQVKKDTERDGNNYLQQAIAYLNNNASALVFPTYFASTYYKAPTTEKVNVNETMNGVFLL